MPGWKKKVKQLFHKKESDIVYSIDRMEMNYSHLVVYGWGVQKTTGSFLDIVAKNRRGMELKTELARYIREDVNTQLGLKTELESGFQIVIPLVLLENYYVKLDLSGEGCKEEVLLDETEMKAISYGSWFEKQLPSKEEQLSQQQHKFALMPLISIVIPVYNTPTRFLKPLLESVQQQTYGNWELCLADGSQGEEGERVAGIIQKYAENDARIRHVKLDKNRGISENTNEAIKAAAGDWILFTDHDDLLSVDALYEIAHGMNEDPDTDVVYTDEDKINGDGTVLFEPAFKPDFNQEFLRENNYICHIFAVKRSLLEQVGMLRSEYDGAQDYDFVLRCCEKAKKIYHVPKVLYHWRAHADSTAGNSESKLYAFEAGRNAVRAHYQRLGIDAEVTMTDNYGHYRTHLPVKGEPLVSILIPNKDHLEDLKNCLTSVIEKSSYHAYEILIIENNSKEAETFQYYEQVQQQYENIRVLYWENEFNYAKIHNFAVPHAKGEYLVLLNNDIEIISQNWLEEMLGYCQCTDVGAVGARLYYPDRTIQHAGVIIGLGGVAGHFFHGMQSVNGGYMNRMAATQELSAVTAACMMTKKSLYEQIGGMDEQFEVSYNDVDYCLKLRSKGYRIVYNPYVEAWHYESKSRGYDTTPQKQERILQESAKFSEKWNAILKDGDPFYNRNLTRTTSDCSLRNT